MIDWTDHRSSYFLYFSDINFLCYVASSHIENHYYALEICRLKYPFLFSLESREIKIGNASTYRM
jgi:hypothetical protein